MSKTNGPSPAQTITEPRPLTEIELETMTKEQLVSYLKRGSTQSPVFNKVVDMSKSLSFEVLNKTGKTVFVKCLYWMKNKREGRWRWDGSKVYEIDHLGKKMIVLDELPDARDRGSCIGYLAVFNDFASADKATKELCDEEKLVDLDKLINLKNKLVTLIVNHYGIEGKRLEFSLASIAPESNQNAKNAPASLDLFVENKTGFDAYITCFIYEQPERADEFSLWRYDKTAIQLIKKDQTARINIPKTYDKYKWSYMRGTLGVFSLNEKNIAQDSTIELLDPEEKLKLGLLSNWQGKKIVITAEKYGVLGDFIDYVIKPMQFFNRRKNLEEPFRLTEQAKLKSSGKNKTKHKKYSKA